MTNPLHHFVTLLMLLALTAGCTTNIKPSVETNPAPAEKFSAFNRFELLPVQAATSAVSDQQAAMKKIEEHTQNILGNRLQQLNAKPLAGQPRTLLIEPTVTELKFVSGGKRFWAGAMAGSSAVIMKAKFTDKETGKLIADPEFYSKASAMSGAYSIGGNDNAMLRRIANWFAVYVFNNYKQAVGGPVVSTDVDAATIPLD